MWSWVLTHWKLTPKLKTYSLPVKLTSPLRITWSTPLPVAKRHQVSKFPGNFIILKTFQESGDYWKRLFLFIGVPSIVLVAINTYKLEEEHNKHLDEHPPAFIPYEHMKIRAKVRIWFFRKI